MRDVSGFLATQSPPGVRQQVDWAGARSGNGSAAAHGCREHHDGGPIAAAGDPRLAGQEVGCLMAQLQAFADANRQHGLRSSAVPEVTLGPADIEGLANYCASPSRWGLTPHPTGHIAAARPWPSIQSRPRASCRSEPVTSSVRRRYGQHLPGNGTEPPDHANPCAGSDHGSAASLRRRVESVAHWAMPGDASASCAAAARWRLRWLH